ncbi:hypothetical protein [Neptuniibacter sp. QD37_11]|uniref:hypothetical protein n=1 Tax=Neptuniibacter sp. QD37_11 TaxID=3398209 RepID=UPI0039F56514
MNTIVLMQSIDRRTLTQCAQRLPMYHWSICPAKESKPSAPLWELYLMTNDVETTASVLRESLLANPVESGRLAAPWFKFDVGCEQSEAVGYLDKLFPAFSASRGAA